MLLFLLRHTRKTAAVLLFIFYSNMLFSASILINKAREKNVFYFSNHLDFKSKTLGNVSGKSRKGNIETSVTNRISENIPGNKQNVTKGYDLKMGGPGQPEMKSFQSVNSSNMVDLFTGDFAYNIPLLDVGGYPINIHYTSGITMDQESSWVGLGWNINPGAITRNLRGLPDDFDGTDSLRKTHNIQVNKTVGVTLEPGVEVVGLPINVSASIGVFHNTYQGFGLETGVGIGGSAGTSFGSLTGSLAIRNNSQTGLTINPSLGISLLKSDGENNLRGSLGISTGYSSRGGLSSLQFNGGISAEAKPESSTAHMPPNSVSFPLASISFAVPSYNPSISMPLTNESFSFTGKIGAVYNAVDPNIAITGYVNKQYIANEDTVQTIPAIGYLYSTLANGRDNVLLDFNREKEMEFNYKTTPHIALPQYTYDAFNISGEGIGGNFRAYRGDVGYVFDHSITTKSKSDNGSLDVGFGGYFHIGMEFTHVTSNSQNHKWKQSNEMEPLIRFKSADTTFEPAYFRNPGEKTTNSSEYRDAIGDDDLIKIGLYGKNDNIKASNHFVHYIDGVKGSEIPVTESIVKKKRDKRSQVISWLNANDASYLGLDKSIVAYNENTFPDGNCASNYKIISRVDGKIRKSNHLSEIDVLNTDGRNYVYGLPVYNINQKDVTFAVNKETSATDIANGLVNYIPGIDNTSANQSGKDHYFSKEELPSYAHSFLLTGILSADYVDITGDGITEDDKGDAIKFNYSQIYGGDKGDYAWRAPIDKNKAHYNEGLKTYSRDDKGNYSYGKKELWYLNSVESKSMIAVFKLSNRQDAFSAESENGGIDNSRSLRKLERIDLYTKSDFLKNGIKARAIKSVHFAYSYELCKGINNNLASGKLTLKSVWFTYNGNENGKIHPYFFNYNPDNNNQIQEKYNPTYNSKNYDRWGSYKDPSTNPGNLNNSDYPYGVQDSALAATYAQAWTLTDIALPSGGKMKISYEADDYAFVQNKRATAMVPFAGVNNPGGTSLYDQNTSEEYYKIYINSNKPLLDKSDILTQYLDIKNVLYFKVAVKMPDDRWGSGYEFVPGYGTVVDYGIVPGNNNQFWVKLAPVEGESPIVRAALQFIRLNLPSKAYPSSELGDNIDLKDAITMLASSISEIKNVLNGFTNESKDKGWCKIIDLSKSMVRLSCPDFKKYGGGLRVKRIEVRDSWDAMTDQKQKQSIYGQEYNYTTSEEVGGKKIIISSGVATYEPAIGTEENPWRTPINYVENVAPLGPRNFYYSEEPIGETFFQSPMVGYSKVRVRTINAKNLSANGWEETEYYTSRDFPVVTEHTFLDNDSKKKYETMSGILRFKHKNHVTLSQGFKIELNDMNGKVKSQSTYPETDSLHPIKSSFNFYKTDNDHAVQKHLNNNVWVADSSSGNINTNGQIGKDIELMTDMREQHSTAYTKSFSPNTDILSALVFPIALASWFHFPQSEDARFRSAAVVKIIQRYGILDSVKVMDKGSIVSTKNMVYDSETGNVLLSRTNNEFNDPVYNFNYPAYWAYSGMGPAYKNLQTIIKSHGTYPSGLKLIKGKLYNETDTTAYPVEKYFESGDEIVIDQAWYASVKPLPNCRQLNPSGGLVTGRKIWVMDAAKGMEGHRGLYFVDENGAPVTYLIGQMRIIRSGKRNMIDAIAGAVSMLNNPIIMSLDGIYKIVIDSNSKVLNTNANTFTDLWKVDNSTYQADSCYTYYKNYTEVFKGQVSLARKKYIIIRADHPVVDSIELNPPYAVASFDFMHYYKKYHSRFYQTKSILNFNLINIPSTAKIKSAIIHFVGLAPIRLWGDTTLRTFDWRYVNNWFYSNDQDITLLQRLTTLWDIHTKYDELTTTDINQVRIVGNNFPYSSFTTITGLMQDLVSNGQSNIIMKLEKEYQTGSRTKYLSFSAKNNGCPIGSGCLQTQPEVTISYTVPRDTCVKVCRNNISNESTNPYRWGIAGNWRIDKAFSYFNLRKENDASNSTTDIRREGTLKNFVPFWNFSQGPLIANEDITRWVWNSRSSNFNTKGFEIENHDPLGRYNSAQYGYNQTLPIAVTQNSKYREALFDGFEDYGYTTNNCINCAPKKEVDFIGNNTGVGISNLQSHTGLYSLHINKGSVSKLTVPIKDLITDTSSANISMRIDSSAVTAPFVVGSGSGLVASYYPSQLRRIMFGTFCLIAAKPSKNLIENIDYHWTSPPVGTCNGSYQLIWKGKFQPRYSENYIFYFKCNGAVTINVTDQQNNNVGNFSGISNGSEIAFYFTPQFEMGKLYNINITYNKRSSDADGDVQLSWKSNSQAKEIIPAKLLYTLNSTAPGSIINKVKYYCISANNVKPINVIKPSFSPIAQSIITISAWLRLDVSDCDGTPAPEKAIMVSLQNSNTIWLSKTGNKIEGWQRYEGNIAVDMNATALVLQLREQNNSSVYIDDIRVHPYNANMKSYVYNPENLRLMSELDENNYATYYEYDDDGTMIRVKKETERGIMTIKETRSALKK